MADLYISNFLSIRSANINLKRINVFIGPQAQGKSVISKLIYFFKEFPLSVYDSITEDKDKRQLNAAWKAKFESIFPPYAWEKNQFLIIYDAGTHKIEVENQAVGTKLKFVIRITDGLNKAIAAGKKILRKSAALELVSNSSLKAPMLHTTDVLTEVAAVLYKDENAKLEEMFYIPAGRSFFSNLQKNLFSFISSSIPIDYFLKEFGAIYERNREPRFVRQTEKHTPKHVTKLINELLCGTYLYDKGEDWILGENGRVSLSNSSSGQQEVLPMAVVLSTWPYINSSYYSRSFVIEEPEAHLFPIAQGQVVSLIASAYNANPVGDFVITTHSPYILTALNNLIQAHNALTAVAPEDSASVYRLVAKDYIVNYEDVSAYVVDRGAVRSIMDSDLRMIRAEAVDSVSEHFSSVFEKLIELEVSGEHAKEDLI